jgi:hypothetical protein
MLLMLVAISGTGVILTRDPTRQAIGASRYGLLLRSCLLPCRRPMGPVVSVIVVPLMTLLALAR